MAVTVAGIVENIRTGTTDPWTWSHDQGTASPQGILVAIIHGTTSTDHVVSVTYGGVALLRLKRNIDTSTEMGAAEWWFRGDSIPTGTQTVSVDLATATTDDLYGLSIALDGADNLAVVDTDGIDENAANPSVTLQYSGRTCMAFGALYSGLTAHTSITANETTITKLTVGELAGNFTAAVVRQITAGTSDFAIGVTAATDDVAYAAVAISEVQAVIFSADAGSYTLTGTSASLSRDVEMPAVGASYTMTGTAATFSRVYAVPAESGSVSLTGTVAALAYQRQMPADAGAYGLTGSTASLQRSYALDAEVTAYAVTGTEAMLNHNTGYFLMADSGTVSLTGQAVALEAIRQLVADTGAYSLSGSEAAVGRMRVMSAESGSLVIEGPGATFLKTQLFDVAPAAYVVSGTAATLVHRGPAPAGSVRLARLRMRTYTLRKPVAV